MRPGAAECGTPALTTPRLRPYGPPHPPSGRHSGGGLTGAGRRGRVAGRARIAVLAHAERGRVFQGPAVLRARRAEGPPRGHLVKPWGTGCGEELREEGAPPQPLSPPAFLTAPSVVGLISSNCDGEVGGGGSQLLQHRPRGGSS